MLVLSRKEGQVIRIGDEIELTIVKVHGKSIRVGISAPEQIRVLRGELAEWMEAPHDRISGQKEDIAA